MLNADIGSGVRLWKKTLDAERYRCKERYFVAMTTPMSTQHNYVKGPVLTQFKKYDNEAFLIHNVYFSYCIDFVFYLYISKATKK